MKHRDSIRRKRLIKNLATSKSLKEAALKAGYAPSTAKSNIYNIKDRLRQDLEKLGYSEEGIKAEFQRLSALSEAQGDMSNAHRGLENIARIGGLFKDKATVNTAIFNLTPEDSTKLREKLRSKSNNDKDLK